LKQHCIGPNCGGNTATPMLDPVTLSTIIGSGIALEVETLLSGK
jgi:hypothetical protein